MKNFGLDKRAFTLAEVLITLGIIGVVAAITIPGLINNYKAVRFKSQFMKSYSTLQQVFKQMESDDVSLNPADYAGTGTYYKIFLNYLQAPLDCGYYKHSISSIPCFDYTQSNYTTFSGKTASTSMLDNGQIALQDGTLLLFQNNYSVDADVILISVDLNGFNNPPNRWGYDLFTFQFIDGELTAMGSKDSKYNDMDTYCSETSSSNINGIACAQKAKTDADYFKNIVRNFK